MQFQQRNFVSSAKKWIYKLKLQNYCTIKEKILLILVKLKNCFLTSSKNFAYNNQNVLNKTHFVILIYSFLWVSRFQFLTIIKNAVLILLNTTNYSIGVHFFFQFSFTFIEVKEQKIIRKLVKHDVIQAHFLSTAEATSDTQLFFFFHPHPSRDAMSRFP